LIFQQLVEMILALAEVVKNSKNVVAQYNLYVI